MGERVKRRYGFPWKGYIASVPVNQGPPDKAMGLPASVGTASSNMVFDPSDGKFIRRYGMAVVGGTSGILEDGTGELTVARCRKVFSLDSPSLTDGYPTHAALYTEEGNHKGCLYLRSTNGSINYVLGQEFSATNHYTADRAGTAVTNNWKVVPYFRTSGSGAATDWGRLNTLALRAFPFAGSRNCLEVGDQLCFPDLDTLPMRWGKRYNESSGAVAGTDNLRLTPLGHLPAPPTVIVTSGTLQAGGSWLATDLFYISVAFEFADGSITPFAIPRDRNDDLASSWGTHMPDGLMKVNIDNGVASTNAYTYLTWSQIPKGPDGTVARRLYRTPKRAGSGTATASTGAAPAVLDLRLTAIIPNNTQTTYQDPNGNDLSLIAIDPVAEFGKSLCPAARYMWQADNRIFVGYTKKNPLAIILWPNVNADDDSDDADADGILDICEDNYEYTLAAGVLTLKKNNSAGTAITCDSTVNIQQVVDRINATTGGGSGGKWYAAVAPGADPYTPCGTAAAANTYLATTTSVDVGDSQYVATGRIRAYGFCLPAPIYFSTTYLAKFPTNKNRFFHTYGGPEAAKNACNAWSALGYNYRTAPDAWGILMGGAPLLDGCIVFYSKAIALYRNTTAGKNGLDKDYILTDLFPNLGCIAWDSIVWGNGWAGCLTTEGFMCFDGTRGGKVNISGDVWAPTAINQIDGGIGVGEWQYEIAQSVAATASDGDGSHFHAKVMGGAIHIAYRSSSSATNGIPDRRLIYDFSRSLGQTGLSEVMDPDGNPWPWSTPLSQNVSVLGEVRKSTGVNRYGAVEANAGANSNGRIEQIDTGNKDNGANVASALLTLADMCGTLKKKSLQEVTMFYSKDATTTLQVYRNYAVGSASAVASITVPASTSNLNVEVLPMPMTARTAAKNIALAWSDTGTGDCNQCWGIEADVLLTDSYT